MHMVNQVRNSATKGAISHSFILKALKFSFLETHHISTRINH